MQRLIAWVAVVACSVFVFNAPLAAQEVLELRPVERGYQFRTKQHIPPTAANRFGLQDPYPQFDASRFDGIAGFSRNHDGRAYQVHVYRTGLFFDLTGIPSNAVVRKASLRFSMVDVREPGVRIRDGGDRCLSVVGQVRMVSPKGMQAWAQGEVSRFADTQPVSVAVPNVAGSTVTVDVTRFFQNANANAANFGGRLGLALAGHREDFKRVRKDRQCMAMVGASSLVLELAPR